MGIKVLFLYPNFRGMNMLPPSIGILSAMLKQNGHTVDLFDTTYYEKLDGADSEVDSDRTKTELLMARPYKMPNEITLRTTNVFVDFKKKVESFSPDLIAMSATEDMFLLGIKLLREVVHHKILTIAGGVFPTFAPNLALSYREIDVVCKGEGEDALRLLCERIERGKTFENINNLWIKDKNGFITFNPTRMVDMDKNPLIDMSIFEEARLYRPMGGKVWRMLPVETHRGCPYECAFCNSPSQQVLYKKEEGKSYLRRKSFENMRKELLYYKDVVKATALYFWADTFFSWKKGEFEQFCEIYQDIKLPFWCQTRIETVNYERLERLQEIGCFRMSFGIEHGNDKFRREVVKRLVSNEKMIQNFEIVNEVGIPFSVNNIVGFPYETRELAFNTVQVNRHIDSTDRNCYAFTPFTGTPLREVCNSLGFLKEEDIVHSIYVNGTVLNMPQFPKPEVDGLLKCFNLYVKFPESRWAEIRQAEPDTPEANALYAKLKDEFVATFWKADSNNFEEASAC